MNLVQPQDNFDTLLEGLISFSPKPDDDKFYLPSTHVTSSSSSSFVPLSLNLVIFSQIVNKNNVTTHSILQIASSMHPPIDLILIQEPYFGRIGTSPQMAQGNPIYDIYGGPKHKDWQAIYPQNTTKDN